MRKLNMQIKLKKTVLRSPLVLLSGTVSPQILRFVRPEAVGLVVLKTITLNSKAPNREPRMWDLGFGVLNSIGLFNPGARNFFEKEIEEYLEFDYDYGLSLAGFSDEEFEELIELTAQLARGIERIRAFELNFSCPNVKEGGIAFASQSEKIERITGFAAERFDGEIWVKVSPAYPVEKQIEAGLKGGATGFVVANTMPAVEVVETGSFVPGAGSGGLSGRALFPINLLNVKKASGLNGLIIASGGVEEFTQVKKYLIAGATLVGLGTVLFRFPDMPNRIYDEMMADIRKNKAQNYDDYLEILRGERNEG
jgi:dihydroorotate dehydrogenase subfamily 1